MQNQSTKVSIKELANLLGVCRKTASKEYQTIIDSLQITRKYLTQKDLEKYGI
jgi:preprotein translocase subunit Sss1